jgi:hypothetical protein
MSFKVIIAGCRDFDDWERLASSCDNILSSIQEEIEIVSGACDDKKKGILTFTREDGSNVYGADGLGERYAKERGYKVRLFFAEWDLYGKPAGVIRNKQMAEYAVGGGAICAWDGWSKGTKNMIENSEAYNLKLRVLRYKKGRK